MDRQPAPLYHPAHEFVVAQRMMEQLEDKKRSDVRQHLEAKLLQRVQREQRGDRVSFWLKVDGYAITTAAMYPGCGIDNEAQARKQVVRDFLADLDDSDVDSLNEQFTAPI